MRNYEIIEFEDTLRNVLEIYIKRVVGEIKDRFEPYVVEEDDMIKLCPILTSVLSRHGEVMINILCHKVSVIIDSLDE
ncbi:MAG: hypothetical protein KA998_00175 [Rickettsiaceae bacterium]|nr:hypothetical protein [Rickettsiaceae bacterium]